jgi:hypothetical protein
MQTSTRLPGGTYQKTVTSILAAENMKSQMQNNGCDSVLEM